MIRLIKGITKLCVAIIVILLALAAFVVFGGSCSSSMPQPFSDARTALMNTALDASGVKTRINDALIDNIALVSEKTGLSESAIATAIDSLDIMNWQVTELPATARETGTYSLPYKDTNIALTTYDTTEVVTVSAYGQTATMRVPESARTYIAFLRYF